MAASKQKKLTVVIPVYNGEKFISYAIQSVLKQKYPSEIIVVDDGSTDSTKSEVAKFGGQVTYVYQENGGPAKARNTGIFETNTEFISFIDSDDEWHPKKLEMQFAEFEKSKNLQITLGLKQIQYSNSKDNNLKLRENGDIVFNLSFGSSLMKRSVFADVGLLDEELRIGEDTDWFFRAREKGMLISVHRDVVQYYRRHKANLTNKNRISTSSVLKVLKKAKDRQANSDAIRTFALTKPSDMDELIEMWDSFRHK